MDDMRKELSAMKSDMGAMRKDIEGLRKSAKTDIKALRSDMRAFEGRLDARFDAFRDEIRALFRPVIATLANHTAELADIRSHIKENLVTRHEFYSYMDKFAGKLGDYGDREARGLWRLDDHEARTGALEKKLS